jgi:hypothetical protein
MFCVQCGTANDSGNAWCVGCGAGLNAAAPEASRKPENSVPPPPPVLKTPASAFCIFCGHTLETQAKFCNACGSDQDPRISAPAGSPVQGLPAAISVPSNTGTPAAQVCAPAPGPAAQFCISCSRKLEPDTRFCIACGADQIAQNAAPFAALIPSPPPAAPPPPVPPVALSPAIQSQAPAPASASLFCFSCGQPIEADIRFCTKCGGDQAQVDTPPHEPDFRPDKSAPKPFAEAPPAAASAFCISCGGRLETGTRFCVGCGADQMGPQESPLASSTFAPPSPAPEAARPAPYDPAVMAPLPAAASRGARRPLLTIVLCAVLLGVLGAGGFLAYRNMDTIKGLFSRRPPGKSQPTNVLQNPAAQPPDGAAQNLPQAVVPETTPPQATPATGTVGANAPLQKEPAEPSRPAAGKYAPATVISPASEIPAKPPSTSINAPKAAPSAPERPAAAEDPVKPKTEAQTMREAVPPKPDPAVTPPPVPANPPAERKPPVPPVEPRGVIQWTGEAAKDQTLIIDGGAASFGTASGRLPGVPCMVTIQPAGISIAEAPGPGNGFGRIVLRFPKKGRFTVTIQWEIVR